MASVKPLTVQFSVDASGGVAGLKVASTAVDGAAQSMRLALGQAGASVSGISEKLREFKTEQVSQARTARFFAGELASIIPGADGARGALQAMVEVGLEGFGIGAALQITVVVLGAINEKLHEQERIASEVRNIHIDTAAEIREALKSISAEIDGQTTKIQKFRSDFAKESRKQADDAKKATAQAVQDAGSVMSTLDAFWTSYLQDLGFNAKTAADKVIEEAYRKPYERAKEFDAQTKAIQTSAGKERVRIAKDISDELVRINAEGTTRIKELEAQLVVDLHKIDLRRDLLEKQRNDLRIAETRRTERAIRDIKLQDLVAEAESAKQQAEEEGEIRKAVLQGEADIGKDHKEKNKAKEKESLATAETIGNAFGASFAGIITGTESVGHAFGQMGKAALHAVLDAVTKSIQAYALEAAAGAAASQSAIPVIGPVLAVAAVGAMEALVMGLLDSIPSSAGGLGTVPRDQLNMVHKGETILPAPLAETYRKAAEGLGGGSGGGGNHYHFHGTLIDEASVRRFVESGAFRRATRESKRNGLAG